MRIVLTPIKITVASRIGVRRHGRQGCQHQTSQQAYHEADRVGREGAMIVPTVGRTSPKNCLLNTSTAAGEYRKRVVPLDHLPAHGAGRYRYPPVGVVVLFIK